MSQGIKSKAAVGSASVRAADDSREPIVITPPNDPEFVNLSDAELDKRLFDLRAERDAIRTRLVRAVTEYEWRARRST